MHHPLNNQKDFLLTTLGSEKRLSNKFSCLYFKENYSLSFGKPAKDACVTWEELKLEVKSPFFSFFFFLFSFVLMTMRKKLQ